MPVTNDIYHETFGDAEKPLIIWAHGWGQSHAAFVPLIKSLEHYAHHISIDFPGFGKSKMPDAVWSTADYADALAEFIKAHTQKPVIWVGHSFGCRVGVQIASRHPNLIKGLFLIAGAGLKRKRPLHKKISNTVQVYSFKFLKKLIPLGLISEDWLKSKFGSPDYRNADPMIRNILVKTVNEDLTDIAQTVKCPTRLVYGTQDTETPVEIGQRFQKLIKGSELNTLEGLDHYSILGSGRHQVTPIFKRFIEDLD